MKNLVIAATLFLSSIASAETIHWTGWISDSKCGSKMTGYCAKSCISAGEKPVFVTDDKQVVSITNPDATQGHEGDRVSITGDLTDGKLTIDTLEPAPKK